MKGIASHIVRFFSLNGKITWVGRNYSGPVRFGGIRSRQGARRNRTVFACTCGKIELEKIPFFTTKETLPG